MITMKAAFDLVCPRANAERLVAQMPQHAEVLANVTWKDAICALVTDEDMVVAGVTIEQVRDAVVFYTATVPRIDRHQIAGTPWARFETPKPGYLVRADGYRMGPAGDH